MLWLLRNASQCTVTRLRLRYIRLFEGFNYVLQDLTLPSEETQYRFDFSYRLISPPAVDDTLSIYWATPYGFAQIYFETGTTGAYQTASIPFEGVPDAEIGLGGDNLITVDFDNIPVYIDKPDVCIPPVWPDPTQQEK